MSDVRILSFEGGKCNIFHRWSTPRSRNKCEPNCKFCNHMEWCMPISLYWPNVRFDIYIRILLGGPLWGMLAWKMIVTFCVRFLLFILVCKICPSFLFSSTTAGCNALDSMLMHVRNIHVRNPGVHVILNY